MKSQTYTLALVLTLPVAALLTGCDTNRQDTNYSMSNPDAKTYETRSSDTNSAAYYNTNTAGRDVNNSGINVRDRDTNNLTPGDQGNTAADIETTQKIRRALVKDTAYSTSAKNVKIITVNGRVTLRGPVNSDSEKSGIESLAKSIAGDASVDNQLEVKSNP